MDPKNHVPQYYDNVDLICENFSRLMIASQSDSSWKKHVAALKTFEKFNCSTGGKIQWPLSIADVKCFIVWCITERKLKWTTASTYVSSLKFVHKLKNLECEDFLKDRIVKSLLSGGENVFYLMERKTPTRRAMNLATLMILGHQIASSGWGEVSKQTTWAACTTAFFTSARMGELLSQYSNTYDSHCTLLWKHVIMTDSNSIIIKLPFTKTKGLKGDVLDIFKFDNMGCCPVTAIKRLKQLHEKKNLYHKDLPVFTFSSGKFLTTSKLNDLLKKLLENEFDKNVDSFTCHSFRAAIPTCIADYPDKSYVEDLKEWGRWDSNSYKLYTKLETNKKRFLFSKIEQILMSDWK
jgi:hypothetical protein